MSHAEKLQRKDARRLRERKHRLHRQRLAVPAGKSDGILAAARGEEQPLVRKGGEAARPGARLPLAAADGAELWRYESPAPLFDLAVLGGEAVCAVGTEKTVVLDLSGAELQTWEHASELSAWEFSDNAAVLRFGETRVVLDAGGAEVYNE